MMKLVSILMSIMLILSLLPDLPAEAQEGKTFKEEELDQMLAQIALYPDALLAQVLMATTYPADVAEAAKWSKANPDQQGDEAVKAVESQPWDPSVKSLVAFPQILATMEQDLDWVQKVGDAFLAQPEDVMDSVQKLRAAAKDEGNLNSSEQQKVIIEEAPETKETVIVIEPTNPQVVYVPTYNPAVIWGRWWWPLYPPVYLPPPPGWRFGAALTTGIAFGIGIGITNALWGGCRWGRGSVNINVNRYNNININNRINSNQRNANWNHNAANRRGVPYRDAKSRERYGKQVPGRENRRDYRGRDPQRDASRDRAQAELRERGADPAKGREQLRNDPRTRDRAQSAVQNTDRNRESVDRAKAGSSDRNRAQSGNQSINRGQDRTRSQNMDRNSSQQASQNRSGDHALKGANNASRTRQSTNRGYSSRQSMQRHGGGGARRGGGGRRR
jgi:hypothetical protein